MSRTLLIMVGFLLASCSAQPQTREYFTKITGVPLCDSAQVRNTPRDPLPNGGHSLYVVEVLMPDTDNCNRLLFGGIESRINAPCAPTMGCSGHSREGEFYRLDMTPHGWRVTYSK
jgi:hypothetical protein